MLWAAESGAINSSVRPLDDQNLTPPSPFLISGYVWYEDGSPCNNPIINLINPNTTMVWYADTISGYNYYQALFCVANVSEGDALEFNVTDRIRSDTTGHTVTADEIDCGCVSNNLTLPQPPRLADRSMMSVHTGSDITEPALFMVYGRVFYDNGSGCTGAVVNISNLNTSMQWQAETDSDHYYYQLVLDAANISIGDVLRISASKDGEPINSTEHVITPEEVSDAAAMVDLNEGSVDLAVSEISHPAGFYADRSSTITAVVKNDGTAYTDGFEAAMFVDGILIETTDVPSMGPGGNRSVNFNWMPELEGNYTIVVMADSGRMINETDESNNNRSMAICVIFTDIDLVITDAIALNKTPLDGDVVRVDATIEDQGNVSTEDFTVVFYDNDDAFHTEILSLDAGGSDTVSACWDARYGEHNIRVIIDPDNMIWETDETNNEGSLNVFVNTSRDFAVTNVTFALDDPSELEWGRTVAMNATIEAVNLANRACSVKVELYRNAYGWNPRQNINETEILFGTGNSTQYLTVEWHIEDRYSIGDLYMTAVIDPDDEIHEPDESNNEMVIPVHVKACDFTVADIAANRTSLIFGETVELNATIKNLGDAAGSAEVEFMVNGTDVLGSGNVSVDTGGTEYVLIDWNTSVTDLAGNGTIAVEVDPDYSVPETDETNNRMTRDMVFVNGTDLAVRSITLDLDEIYIYQGDVVNVSALIENRGAIDAVDFSVEFYDYNKFYGNISLINLTNISSLLSGGSMYVNATWDLSGASIGEHTMLVKIDHCDNPDNDVSNNEYKVERNVIIPWEVVNVSVPPFPKEGENVTIAATVKNNGGRAGTASVEFYLDGKLFREKKLYIGAKSTNSTRVVWNARPLFSGPNDLTTSRMIWVDAGGIGSANYTNIVTADLTIEDIVMDSNYNITLTVKNNENRDVNSTLWFYDVNETYYNISRQCSESVVNRSYQGASNMSVCFDKTRIFSGSGCKGGKCIVRDKNGGEIYSIHRDTDGSTPVPDGWVTWGSGDTIGITYKNMNGAFISAAVLESRHIALNNNETKNFTVKWNATMGEDHTVWAQLSNTNKSKFISLDIDLAVTNVSVDNETSDGDQETITAVITNLGHGNASDFKVMFFNDTNLFHTENITNLDSGVTTTVDAIWTADTWDESEGKAILNHTIIVEIDPCGNADINESNNTKSRFIRVNPTRDFSVTNITFAQDEVTEQTKINATIRNFGRAGSTNVSICVNNGTETIQIYSGSHWIDSEYYVDMTWNASMAGNCTINVTADPDNRTLETDESNNSMALPVYIEAPDLTVKRLTIDPVYLIEGNTTNVTATIANIGDRDVDNITVAFCDRGNHIRRGDWILQKGASEVTITEPDAAGMRVHFKELDVHGGASMRIYDENGNQVIDMMDVNKSNMWTEWIPGSSVRIKISDLSFCFAEIDRYEYHKIFNRTNLSLDANTSKEIRTNWTAYPSGPHEISLIVDPDDDILELNETGNELTNFNVVQGPDISVDLTLNNTNPVDGAVMNITACIKNTGVLPANNFTVKIEIDNDEVYVSEPISLLRNETLYISTTWKATIGDHILWVTADPDETIFETSEENNADSINVFVNAPDLDVTDIELNPADPMDGDETWINATIANQGFQRANNFSVDIFYEYSEFEGSLEPFESYSADGGNPWGERWVNLTWKNKTVDAGCIYIHIEEIRGSTMLRVYDRNNILVTNSTASKWIAVMGNAANISIHAGNWNSMKMRFYAGNVTRFNNLSLDINESLRLGMMQEVSTGRHNIRVFADTGNGVNETNEENNIRRKTMDVQPSRDFSVSYIGVSTNGSEIGVNNTPVDGDPVIVCATVENTGFKKGIVDVNIIDEHEWVDASPRYELTSYGYAQVISYPGADEMRLHFRKLDVSPYGVVEIRNRYGALLCTISSYTQISPWVSGDEIYVYRVRKPTVYDRHGHITCNIDKYQYIKINRTTVELAANGTANTSVRFIPDAWTHTIRVITDPDDKIGELNESNNEANKTIDVKACRDPAVVDVKFSPEKPYPGDAVNVTATVTNYGSRIANFTVDIEALKFEYLPRESPHGSDLVNGFEEDITTYPEADWTGVHFTRISTVAGIDKTFLRIYDRGGNMSTCYYGFEGNDIWEWVRGDTIQVTLPKLAQRSAIQGCEIDKRAHIVTLNNTKVTLDPGETANITGILPNVRIGHRSISYTVTAVVDQDNAIFETDESNNELSRELVARCPDLTVDKNLHFADGKAMAVIKNIGTGKAEDVEVRFWHDANYTKYKKDHHRREHSGMELPPRNAKPEDPDGDSDEYPNAVRVHFDELKVDHGTLRVWNRTTKIHTLPPGNYYDGWVEGEGEECSIYYDSAHVRIDRYEYAKDESVGDISAYGGRRKEEIPWTGYEEPYNLTIDIDPAGGIAESNEDNNNETIEMGADVSVDLTGSITPTYLVVDHPVNFFIRIKNIGALLTPEFNVTLYADTDDGGMVPVENHTMDILEPTDACDVKFEWKPSEARYYEFIVKADSDEDVAELNENNNEIVFVIPAFKNFGYDGSYLKTYREGEVNGSVIFRMGGRIGESDPRHWYEGAFPIIEDTYRVQWNIPIPEDASIRIARLYLYWGYTMGYTQPTEFKVRFNDHPVEQDPGYPVYSDYPIEEDVAYGFNYAYGVYGYDVKDYVTGIDEATVKICDLHGAAYTCIAGMGLLIIYESDDGIFTKYWINEGADVLGCGGSDTGFSPLLPDDCTTEVVFKGDADSDGLSNATLITVVPWGSEGDQKVDETFYRGTKWGGKKRNGLYFNGKELKDGAWAGDPDKDSVGIDERDVKDHLVKRDNVAEIQDRGDNMMVSANAFLILRYPPDLNIIDLSAPASTVVGAHHSINVTIRNDGRSDAHDFNATLEIDGRQMVRIPNLDLAAGENMTIHLYNWTPMLLGHVYNLTAAADVLSGEDWIEIETGNNAMTKYVSIEEGGFGNQTGPRGTGGGSKPTGGEFTKKITGRIMQGTKEFLSGGGGGGAGMFSALEWLMKGAVWLVLVLFVGLGYRIEKRSYGRVSGGYAGGL